LEQLLTPRRKLLLPTCLRHIEVSNFLQELVSKPTGFWNKLNYVCIVIGGGIGALLRYFSGNVFTHVKFPFGTLFVNCLGALLTGFLINFFNIFQFNVKWKLFLITGFLGSYTTFSAYSLETAHYFINGKIKHALINILLNNVLCILFVLLGIWLNKIIIPKSGMLFVFLGMWLNKIITPK
jgi:CrcB protein